MYPVLYNLYSVSTFLESDLYVLEMTISFEILEKKSFATAYLFIP